MYFISVVLLFAGLFSAGPAMACGEKRGCCPSRKETKKEDKQAKADYAHPKKSKDCDGCCNKKGCPCPQTSGGCQASAVLADFHLNLQVFSVGGKSEWYFQGNAPQAIYLSLRLPPKI